MDITEVETVEPLEAASLLAAGEAIALDVRQQHEWDAGHIDQAIHVPASGVVARIGDLADGRVVIVVCRSGNRSGRVVEALAKDGRHAFNLRGGMRAWHADELPMVPPDGRVV